MDNNKTDQLKVENSPRNLKVLFSFCALGPNVIILTKERYVLFITGSRVL